MIWPIKYLGKNEVLIFSEWRSPKFISDTPFNLLFWKQRFREHPHIQHGFGSVLQWPSPKFQVSINTINFNVYVHSKRSPKIVFIRKIYLYTHFKSLAIIFIFTCSLNDTCKFWIFLWWWGILRQLSVSAGQVYWLHWVQGWVRMGDLFEILWKGTGLEGRNFPGQKGVGASGDLRFRSRIVIFNYFEGLVGISSSGKIHTISLVWVKTRYFIPT